MIVVDCNIWAWLVLPFGKQSLGRQLLVKDREWASVPLITEDRAILSAFPDIACTTAAYLETST